MPLTLVLGPANSAKAGEVLGAYAAAAQRDALLVVPTSADVQHYSRELAEQGTVLSSVLTFPRLVGEIADRVGLTGRRLSPVARRRIMRRVLAGLELQELRESASGQGFATAAVALVAELGRELVSPQRFAQALSAWQARGGTGEGYARELSQIPIAYARELERGGWLDDETLTWRALDGLRRRARAWGSTAVFWYGFDDLSALERDAVETLARVVGVDVTVSLTYEPGRSALGARTEVVQELQTVAQQVRQLPAIEDHYRPGSREALHHLERWVFETSPPRLDPGDAVKLLEAGGELAQAELVAAEVLALLAEGVPAPQVVVVCRSLPRGAPALIETFARYGIAWAAELRLPLRHTRLGRSAWALARCAWVPEADAAELVEALRWPGLADVAAVDRLEAQVRRRRLRGAESAAAAWGGWPPLVMQLRAGSDPAEALADAAGELLACPWRGQAPLLDAEAELDARALAALQSALAEAAQLGERLGASEVLELLEDVEVPAGRPWREDAVLLAEPLAIRARRFHTVIVCGLGEGEFPAAGTAEPFLSDEQRWELAGASGLRLPGHEDALPRERYLFYACASRASSRLVLAYCSSDEEGNLALPSPFIADVEDLFCAGWAQRRRQRLLADVVWDPSDAPTPQERARGAAAVAPVPPVAPADADRRLSAAALEVIRHRSVVSAGALERFADCPVKWLVERQLNPRPLAPDPDPVVRGKLMHRVLEAVMERLGEALTGRTLPRALQLLAEELQRPPEVVAPGQPPAVRAAVLAGFEADLRRYLIAEAGDGCEWPVAALEQRFGFAAEDSLPELVLGEGPEQIRLRGVIDRVDVDPATGSRAAVRDYKSAAKRPEHPGARWLADRRPQVALYMLAVQQLLGLEPVAGFLQPLSGPDLRPRGVFRAGEPLGTRVVDGDGRTEEELRELLQEAAAWAMAVAGRIRRGEIDPCPQTCGRDGCRYPGICRSE